MLDFHVVEARELLPISHNAEYVEYRHVHAFPALRVAELKLHHIICEVPGYGRGVFDCVEGGWSYNLHRNVVVPLELIEVDRIEQTRVAMTSGDELHLTATITMPNDTRCFMLAGFSVAYVGIILFPGGLPAEYLSRDDRWASKNQSQWLRSI